MNIASSPTDEISDDITALDASQFISERCNDCELASDVCMFEKHQQQDKLLKNHNEEELKQRPNSMVYTTKEVEGVYLTHKNNRILVPSTLQMRVMDWYHNILVYPGEKRMEESIRSIHTWRGLQPDVTNYYNTCNIY